MDNYEAEADCLGKWEGSLQVTGTPRRSRFDPNSLTETITMSKPCSPSRGAGGLRMAGGSKFGHLSPPLE